MTTPPRGAALHVTDAPFHRCNDCSTIFKGPKALAVHVHTTKHQNYETTHSRAFDRYLKPLLLNELKGIIGNARPKN